MNIKGRELRTLKEILGPVPVTNVYKVYVVFSYT